MPRSGVLGLVFLLAAVSGACGSAPYQMTTPEGFKKYERSRDFKYITPDGVMLKAREVDNYPRADLPFWTQALRRHLEERGYAFSAEKSFRTAAGREGATLTFLLPHGAEDWVLSVTLFVVAERLVLIEAAAPYSRFAPREAAIAAALATFEPRAKKP